MEANSGALAEVDVDVQIIGGEHSHSHAHDHSHAHAHSHSHSHAHPTGDTANANAPKRAASEANDDEHCHSGKRRNAVDRHALKQLVIATILCCIFMIGEAAGTFALLLRLLSASTFDFLVANQRCFENLASPLSCIAIATFISECPKKGRKTNMASRVNV